MLIHLIHAGQRAISTGHATVCRKGAVACARTKADRPRSRVLNSRCFRPSNSSVTAHLPPSPTMAFRLSLRLASQTPPKRIVSVGVGSPNGRSLWTRPPTVLSRPANCTSSGVNHSLAPRQSPMQGLTQKLALRTISVESAGQSPVHLSALQKGLRIGAALAFLAGGFGCLTLISEHYVTLKEEAAFLQSASLHAAVGVGISVTSIVALASLAKTRSMMLNFPIRFSLLVCIPAIGSAMLLNQIPGDKAPLRYLWWAAEMAAQGAVWAPLV